eukprot:4250056-Amphidinium_carterae.2
MQDCDSEYCIHIELDVHGSEHVQVVSTLCFTLRSCTMADLFTHSRAYTPQDLGAGRYSAARQSTDTQRVGESEAYPYSADRQPKVAHPALALQQLRECWGVAAIPIARLHWEVQRREQSACASAMRRKSEKLTKQQQNNEQK